MVQVQRKIKELCDILTWSSYTNTNIHNLQHQHKQVVQVFKMEIHHVQSINKLSTS